MKCIKCSDRNIYFSRTKTKIKKLFVQLQCTCYVRIEYYKCQNETKGFRSETSAPTPSKILFKGNKKNLLFIEFSY